MGQGILSVPGMASLVKRLPGRCAAGNMSVFTDVCYYRQEASKLCSFTRSDPPLMASLQAVPADTSMAITSFRRLWAP